MLANWPVTSGGAGWAVLQLIEDEIIITDLDADLSAIMPGIVLYVPAVRDWKVDSRSALSTYAFAIVNQPDAAFFKLKASRFVADVLCQPTSRKLARVTDAELADMVRVEPSPDLAPGVEVEMTTGDWEGLIGVIERVTPERVLVSIPLRSGARTVEVPVADVRPVADAA